MILKLSKIKILNYQRIFQKGRKPLKQNKINKLIMIKLTRAITRSIT